MTHKSPRFDVKTMRTKYGVNLVIGTNPREVTAEVEAFATLLDVDSPRREQVVLTGSRDRLQSWQKKIQGSQVKVYVPPESQQSSKLWDECWVLESLQDFINHQKTRVMVCRQNSIPFPVEWQAVLYIDGCHDMKYFVNSFTLGWLLENPGAIFTEVFFTAENYDSVDLQVRRHISTIFCLNLPQDEQLELLHRELGKQRDPDLSQFSDLSKFQKASKAIFKEKDNRLVLMSGAAFAALYYYDSIDLHCICALGLEGPIGLTESTKLTKPMEVSEVNELKTANEMETLACTMTKEKNHEKQEPLVTITLPTQATPTKVFEVGSEPKTLNCDVDKPLLYISSRRKERIFVVDNFYEDALAVREHALSLRFDRRGNFPGSRTASLANSALRAAIQEHLHPWQITLFRSGPDSANGAFQITTSADRNWVHVNYETFAGVLFLTPDAPASAGTSFYRLRQDSKQVDDLQTTELQETQNQSRAVAYDMTKWEEVDKIGNVFNRLVLFDSQRFHMCQDHFGGDLKTGRLTQVFFFNAAKPDNSS